MTATSLLSKTWNLVKHVDSLSRVRNESSYAVSVAVKLWETNNPLSVGKADAERIRFSLIFFH